MLDQIVHTLKTNILILAGILFSGAMYAVTFVGGFFAVTSRETEWLVSFFDHIAFIPTVFALQFDTDIMITLPIYAVTIGILLGLTAVLFKKKDPKAFL